MSKTLAKHDDTTALDTTRLPVVAPRADIFERQDGFLLVLDMPGVTSESLEVNVDSDVVTIRGVKAATHLSGYELAYSESRPGVFERSFSVSDEVDVDRISASMVDGVLRVTFPRKESAKPRRIDVSYS